VFIPDYNYFYGFLNKIEQFQDNKNDVTYFEIRKFLKLACDNNPNIVELLFIPENKMLICTKEFEEIIENRKYIISKKVKHTFSGYAHSQFNRIKLHRNWLLNPPKKKPERKDFGLSEHKSNLTRDQIGAFNKLLALKLDNIVEFHPLKEQIEKMKETHDFNILCGQYLKLDKDALQEIIPISDEFINILQKENGYAQAERHFNQYQNWKRNRNPTRAVLEEKFGFDTKHGAHLVRLISEADELLNTGFITFPRPDAEYLLEIRNGKYKYEELEDIIENYDNKFEEYYKTSKLEKSADMNIVDNLCMKLCEEFLDKGKQ